ncbi:MAG: metal ABC transporter permease, partial [Deltaproteobacteria bacterium]|nr:metal ABC transporter permease [Deltaproteobacteria bacterium]
MVSVMTLSSGANTSVVILGTTTLGIAAGLVGAFSVLRKRALIGDALSHCALPGVAIAFLLGVALGGDGKAFGLLLLGATVSGIAGVLTVQFLTEYTRLPEDASIGAVLSVFFGIGVVLLSVIQSLETGSSGGLNHFIYGQTAALRIRDAQIILATASCSIILSLLLLKEFRILCFDDVFAQAQGYSARALDIVMMALIVGVTVIGLQSVGLILMVAFLVTPAVAARFWTDRFEIVVLLSGLFGGMSGYFGSVMSALFPQIPAGSVIVLVCGAIFFVSLLLAPKRGLITRAISRRGLVH